MEYEAKEAMFYKKLDGIMVKCNLCSHNCKIADSKRGLCGVRENRGGTLYTLVYGRVVAMAIDPIEKKPLFHFHPASSSYSLATVGCNFRCLNCQNYEISQSSKPQKRIIGEQMSPEEVVEAAKENGCKSIAYTYSEPTVFFEYAYDIAKLAKREGIKNIFVTNGYIREEALQTIKPYLDAANIDLKSFSDEFHQKVCGARLQPVLDSIKLHKEMGIWIEITTLVIPTLNDSRDNLKKIAEFIKDVDAGIPWHVSRFFPNYKLMYLLPTQVETLRMARKIGMDSGLRYVYQGNVSGEGETTFCYNCGEPLVTRFGYFVNKTNIKDSMCPRCNTRIDGVWE